MGLELETQCSGLRGQAAAIAHALLLPSQLPVPGGGEEGQRRDYLMALAMVELGVG